NGPGRLEAIVHSSVAAIRRPSGAALARIDPPTLKFSFVLDEGDPLGKRRKLTSTVTNPGAPAANQFRFDPTDNNVVLGAAVQPDEWIEFTYQAIQPETMTLPV